MAYVPIAGDEGNVWVPEGNLSDEELSVIGAHRDAIGAFLSHDPEGARRVAEHEGTVVAGVALVTDLDRIEELGAENRFDIDEFYRQSPP